VRGAKKSSGTHPAEVNGVVAALSFSPNQPPKPYINLHKRDFCAAATAIEINEATIIAGV